MSALVTQARPYMAELLMARATTVCNVAGRRSFCRRNLDGSSRTNPNEHSMDCARVDVGATLILAVPAWA